MRWRGISALVVIVVALASMPASASAARDQVRSFDGTRIVLNYFEGTGKGPRPTVLVGHGFGGRGDGPNSPYGGASGYIGTRPLLEAGYNVLTWDARGFGDSGGKIMIDSPEFEGRDVSALIDYVAEQPSALLDRRGDPRVGMGGGSYGGGVQIAAASRDRRIDAIVPNISWHSLVDTFNRDGAIKTGWGLLLSAGGATSIPGGLRDPDGTQVRYLPPEAVGALANGIATGSFSDADRRYFASRGPGPLIRKVRAPTLLVQGTVDTLFTPGEADRNFRALEDAGTPVKMIWFCGGHGTCGTDPGNTERVGRAMITWFDRYLRDRKVNTGRKFRWISEPDGAWHSASRYPLRSRGALRGQGAGSLALAPGLVSGQLTLSTPVAPPLSVEVEIPASSRAVELVGPPEVEITYSGAAAPAKTLIYGQIVDNRSGEVLGHQITPIPLTLDGGTHTVKRDLELIAASGRPGSSYTLQLVAGSTVWGPQRSAGVAQLQSVKVALPVVAAR